jgi:hypothetical protein
VSEHGSEGKPPKPSRWEESHRGKEGHGKRVRMRDRWRGLAVTNNKKWKCLRRRRKRKRKDFIRF